MATRTTSGFAAPPLPGPRRARAGAPDGRRHDRQRAAHGRHRRRAARAARRARRDDPAHTRAALGAPVRRDAADRAGAAEAGQHGLSLRRATTPPTRATAARARRLRALRMIAPMVVLSTLVVFASGVALLFAGPSSRSDAVADPQGQLLRVARLHGAARARPPAGIPQALRGGLRPQPHGLSGDVTGRAGRMLALAGALVAGARARDPRDPRIRPLASLVRAVPPPLTDSILRHRASTPPTPATPPWASCAASIAG